MTKVKNIIDEMMERMNHPVGAFRIDVYGAHICMLINKKCESYGGGPYGGFIPGDCRCCVFANHFLEHLEDSWFFNEESVRKLFKTVDEAKKELQKEREQMEKMRKAAEKEAKY